MYAHSRDISTSWLVIQGHRSHKEKSREGERSNRRTSATGTLSTQAYKLFSEGKSPVQVSIALNLRQTQVTEFYIEHWKLKGLYMLNQIYEEIQGNIGYFVNLYRLARGWRY